MDFEKFYDQQSDYEAFRNDPVKREEYNIIVEWKASQLAKLIPGSKHFKNILEVGCALGILLNNIADRLKITERIGLDISSENILVAKELHPETLFLRGTIEDLNKKSQEKFQFTRFDLVVLSDIVEHIPDDINFMTEVKKISSLVLLNLPLEKCFTTRNRQYGESDTSGHLRCYDEKMAIRLINRAGFEILNSFTSNAIRDKAFLEIYRKKRRLRLKNKPLYLRLFWKIFYLIEDNFKLSNKRLSEKIFGTNYFALLKSVQ